MADLTAINSVTMQQLMQNIELYKNNPTLIQRVIHDCVDEIMNGQIQFVDPTNPLILLMECSCANTAIAVQDNMINARKQYPSLSQTEEDIYLHMADKDFIDRFATPASTKFTVMVQVADIDNKMVYDESEKAHKATIPRDTEFVADDLIFTLQYPIDIRKFDNGIVQVSYDATIDSPLQSLSTNIIDYVVLADQDRILWLNFEVPVTQFAISSTTMPIQKSSIFSKDISYSDLYYYCRVYYRNSANGNVWKEINTTHTDQVFDIKTPTAVLKVMTGTLNVTIPPIYANSGLISGDIRIDVFTTKGNITVNFANYKLDLFQLKLKAIDQDRDINQYTNAMLTMTLFTFNGNTISGGSGALDFETLREQVINNNVGERKLPITNNQLDSYVAKRGFELIKNVDTITNRIFLAASVLPKPINERLITPANIGITSFITNLEYLKTLTTAADNGQRVTILSNNVFINNNGIVTLVTKPQLDALLLQNKTNIVTEVNSKDYLYNPFYYVLDNSQDEFSVRIYNLDQPKAANLNFIEQNETLQLPVNTGSYSFTKTSYGYQLLITTKSGNFYKQIADDLVAAQVGYKPTGEKDFAYINGSLTGKTSEGERIYSFRIETNHDIDEKDNIIITNARMFTNEIVAAPIVLQPELHIFYTTNSVGVNFIASTSDQLIGKFMLPTSSACITHESLQLTLGSSLKNLWSRSRSLAAGLTYETYTEDVPLLYDRVVYDTDPVTGSIFTFGEDGKPIYLISHRIGDPALDDDGNQIYRHRRGDVKLDSNGQPIINTGLTVDREIDMLFVDGKYYFANDTVFVDYRQEIMAVIDSWVTDDLSEIQDILLEQTRIYLYPKTSLGLVKSYPDGTEEKYIDSGQSFILELYVDNNVFTSTDIRQNISDSIIKLLDSYINSLTINITEIRQALVTTLGNSVVGLEIKGLGGDANYSVVKLADEHNRLSLKKKLLMQQDGSFVINEDVIINFHNVER